MAEATTVDESNISIKVIVDKEKKRVVYAEADYTFVDILFSFMTLPLGTIVRLFGKQADKKFEALGSLNNLYQSLVDFPERYLSSEECKSVLLNPRSPAYDLCRTLKLKIDDTEPIKYYKCTYCWNNCFGYQFSTFNAARCDKCGWLMSQEVSLNDSTRFGDCAGGVFVSDIATFIVTDDLCVMPYTLGGSIQLLADHGITEMSHLEERKLDIGCEQMLYILKLGLSLNSPLTYLVFPERLVCVEQGSFDKCSLIKKGGSTSSKMTLEVSMQKSTGKLLFAEAKEDFVDFVFGFLAIPLGTLVGTLLNGASSLICMDNLFKSISNMNVGSYLKSQDIKDILLKPSYGQHYTSENRVFPLESTVITIRHSGVTAKLKDPRSADGGLLKRPGMFMVTDDLVITPSSSLSLIDALNKLNGPFNDIEKHEISIGLEEGLKLLQASLKGRSTLTNSLKNQLKK